MAVRLNVCDGWGDIGAGHRRWMLATAEGVVGKAGPLLHLDGTAAPVDVNILVAPKMVIPEYGVSGFTLNRSVVQIALDPWSPRFAAPECPARFGAVLAHELHHVARLRSPAAEWKPTHLSKRSLGHVLVLEGLAQAFEEEMGYPTPFYAMAVSGPQLWDLADRARAEFEAFNADYDAWLFGRHGDPRYPRYGGYSVGFALMKGWLSYKTSTASGEIDVLAQDVLDAWRDGKIVVT